MNQYQWIVSQLGSRQHYAVPRVFHQRNQLDILLTEFWCRFGESVFRYGPPKVRAMAGRRHDQLPNAKIKSFNVSSIVGQLRPRVTGVSQTALYEEYARIGKAFSELVNRAIRGRNIEKKKSAFFGFQTGALETLRFMKELGVLCILDQTDPAKAEEDLVFEEMERWPGWAASVGRIPQNYWDRSQAEWATANYVLVNSVWSKTALVKQGVSSDKIIIVPHAYESKFIPTSNTSPRNTDASLMVLWVGSVILRKGIPYLIEAAKFLKDRNIRFVIAGPIGISQHALKQAPPNMTFLGRITRDQTASVYQQADVFVLPTISDGFAITQLEAMSHGLPVITTPNCGEVVEDRKNGLIVPIRDSAALAAAIVSLDDDRQFLAAMSENARIHAGTFTLSNFGNLLDRQIATATTQRDHF